VGPRPKQIAHSQFRHRRVEFRERDGLSLPFSKTNQVAQKETDPRVARLRKGREEDVVLAESEKPEAVIPRQRRLLFQTRQSHVSTTAWIAHVRRPREAMETPM